MKKSLDDFNNTRSRTLGRTQKMRDDIKELMNYFSRRELIRLVDEVHECGKSYPVDDAVQFLEKVLDKPRLIKHVRKQAEDYGISQSTLYRAANQLRLKKKSTGFGKNKRSWWSLR